MPPDQTLWFVNEPQPLHHVTVVKRLQHMPNGFTARVLILRRPDGTAEPYIPLIRYQAAHPHRSSSWQNTISRALGLLWDYANSQLRFETPRDLFRSFALALISGTIEADGDDPTGLLWPSTHRDRAVRLVKAIEAFAEWCGNEDGIGSPSLPKFSRSDLERVST
ncbi:MAG TPA: hypothetical protein VGJ01_02805 [Pseudolabrys sp.]